MTMTMIMMRRRRRTPPPPAPAAIGTIEDEADCESVPIDTGMLVVVDPVVTVV